MQKTICQNCGTNIDETVRQYFWDMLPRSDFEINCPECGVVQDVEVVAVPTFKLFNKAAQQSHALDATPVGVSEK